MNPVKWFYDELLRGSIQSMYQDIEPTKVQREKDLL